MKKLDKLKLTFPELEDHIKQSTKGGLGEYGDDDDWGNYGGYGSPENPINLPPVFVNPGNTIDPYPYPTTGAGLYPWGWGDSYSDNIGGYSFGGTGPLPTFNEYVIDIIETTNSAFTNQNLLAVHTAEIAQKYSSEARAIEVIEQLKRVGDILRNTGVALTTYDAYVAISDHKLTVGEGTKIIADVVFGKISSTIPIAGPIIGFTYTALDATGQIQTFIEWIYPDKLEDKVLIEVWKKMETLNATGGKTFLETFGRNPISEVLPPIEGGGSTDGPIDDHYPMYYPG